MAVVRVGCWIAMKCRLYKYVKIRLSKIHEVHVDALCYRSLINCINDEICS